jgi:hypothetical protein
MPSSPRRRIRLASVAGGLKDCSDPVGSTLLRRLDTSNGCRDHTVLPYAAHRLRHQASPGIACPPKLREGGAPVVYALRSLTDDRSALQARHAPNAAASTATRPSFLTMANAPLGGTGWERCKGDLRSASRRISVKQKFRQSERLHRVDLTEQISAKRLRVSRPFIR